MGILNRNMWLVRTDADGDSLWSRTFVRENTEWCFSIIQTTDGGFALAGLTYSLGTRNWDMWLIKIDSDGDSLWSRTFGGSNDEQCFSIIQTTDGGYALAGWTKSFGAGDKDMWLVKTDEDGDSLWSRTFGGDNSDVCNSLIQTADGGFALGGYTRSFGAGDYDMWLVKTDADGDSLWSRTFGGEGSDQCHSMIQTADGGFALAGWAESFGAGRSDMWLVRTNADGDSLWSRTFGGEDWDRCFSVIQTTDRGYALAGYTRSFGAGNYDFWLVRTGPDPVSVPPASFILHPSSFILLESFPNPFNSTTNIRFGLPKNELVLVRIIDLTGNVVETLIDGRLPAGYHTVSWNSLDYPTGVYICNMQAAGFSEAVKMVLVK